MTTAVTARIIKPDFLTKLWGSPHTEPWFKPRIDPITGHQLGEVWFTVEDLLIKFIFTSENLSVQVHPDDDYALRHENSRGKTEMWYILRAEPGARIAVGFRHEIPAAEMIGAAESGQIMNLLNWIEVQPGETYFVPAGTVHAIGAGIALCEIQQNSDVTYRLYDYGRGRKLHLGPAREVSRCVSHPGQSVPHRIADGIDLLVNCQYFRTYRTVVDRRATVGGPEVDTRFLVVLEGRGTVNGLPVRPGSVLERLESEGERTQGWVIEPRLVQTEGPKNFGPMKILLVA